jgi:hypothetical protein
MAGSEIIAFARRGAIGALLAGVVAGRLGAKKRELPRILFVCQYGSVKSAIARELLRRRARERGIALRAFSRGITPEAHLPAEIEARLRAEGIDAGGDGLHRLLPVDAGAADIVVYFNPLPANIVAARSLDWTSVPSVLGTYPAARADMNRRIEALLDSLER